LSDFFKRAWGVIKLGWEWFMKTLPVWMLLSGIAIIVAAHYREFGPDDKFNELMGSLGNTIVQGGVFAAVLKSFQYIGIFKDELAKIVYDTKFIENRKDLKDIWGRVSAALYKKKFPAISDQIQATILDSYFPIEEKNNFYYDRLFQKLDITFVGREKEYVSVKETLEFTIKHGDIKQPITWPYQTLIDKAPGDERTSWVLDKLIINKKHDRKGDCPDDAASDHQGGKYLKVSFSLLLSGEEEYHLEMVHTKVYSLRANKMTKGFNAGRFINKFELYVSYPDDLGVTFYSNGTPSEWGDHPGASDGLIWKKYDGLIFPSQGYRLTFS
jgi:hypothetical protein